MNLSRSPYLNCDPLHCHSFLTGNPDRYFSVMIRVLYEIFRTWIFYIQIVPPVVITVTRGGTTIKGTVHAPSGENIPGRSAM